MDYHVERVDQLRTQLQEKHRAYEQAAEHEQPELVAAIQELTSQVLEEEAAIPARQQADRDRAEARKLAAKQAINQKALEGSLPALYGAMFLCVLIALAMVGLAFWGPVPGGFVLLAAVPFALGVQFGRIAGVTEHPPKTPDVQDRLPNPRPRKVFAALGSLAALACLLISLGWLPLWVNYPLLLGGGIPTVFWSFDVLNPPARAATAQQATTR